MFQKAKNVVVAMFHKAKNAVVAVAVGASALTFTVPSHAALSAADLTAIQTSLVGADASFYQIGGTILTVMAGFWAFYKIVGLLRGH